MHKKKCPVCKSMHTVKNGKRKGCQLYKCADCGYQFRSNSLPGEADLWRLYQEGKQTVRELSASLGVSPSTVKRRLQLVSMEWEQPLLCGGGFFHLDATYWGHNWGVMLGVDEQTGRVIYMAFIRSETTADYVAAVESIERRGYAIKGLIVDGKKSLFSVFSAYRIQMCQFHMKQIVRRYLTKNPRLRAARALKRLVQTLTVAQRADFERDFQGWKEE